jgi:hypothetical protein
VRKFFDCYTDGRPEDFDECAAPDYVDYGHEPPGIGPESVASLVQARFVSLG